MSRTPTSIQYPNYFWMEIKGSPGQECTICIYVITYTHGQSRPMSSDKYKYIYIQIQIEVPLNISYTYIGLNNCTAAEGHR